MGGGFTVDNLILIKNKKGSERMKLQFKSFDGIMTIDVNINKGIEMFVKFNEQDMENQDKEETE